MTRHREVTMHRYRESFVIKTIAALFIAFGLSISALVISAQANPAYDLGPAMGSKVPTIGMPQDETGTPRSLESLAGEKGTVLFFFRSAAWCPYCQLQLMDLNSGVADLAKRGYRLAGISYEPPAVDADFIQKRGLKYPLLSDPKSEIIDRYKLRDPQYKTNRQRNLQLAEDLRARLDRAALAGGDDYVRRHHDRGAWSPVLSPAGPRSLRAGCCG